MVALREMFESGAPSARASQASPAASPRRAAATVVVQAGGRGMLARQHSRAIRTDATRTASAPAAAAEATVAEALREQAATRVQARARGRSSRRKTRTQYAGMGPSLSGPSAADAVGPSGAQPPDKAATTLQAGSRGMLARSRTRELRTETSPVPPAAPAPTPAQGAPLAAQEAASGSGQGGHAKAATTVQAGGRGMLARRQTRSLQVERATVGPAAAARPATLVRSRTDLGGPPQGSREKAATAIQSGGRGMLARSRTRALRVDGPAAASQTDVGPNRRERAATTLQAGSRGMLARRHARAIRTRPWHVLLGNKPDPAVPTATLVLQLLQDVLANRGMRVVDLFREWDRNDSGFISLKEFGVALQPLELGIPNIAVRGLFESLDADGSGSIRYAEIYRPLAARRASADIRIGREVTAVAAPAVAPALEAPALEAGMALAIHMAAAMAPATAEPAPAPEPALETPAPAPAPRPRPRPRPRLS